MALRVGWFEPMYRSDSLVEDYHAPTSVGVGRTSVRESWTYIGCGLLAIVNPLPQRTTDKSDRSHVVL